MPLPPGPRASAALQTAWWVASPARFLERVAAHFGDPCTIRVTWMPGPLVLTWDPDAMATVFREAPEGGGSPVLEPFAGPRSILVLDGDEHLAERRRMLPAFHGDALRAWRAEVAAIAAEHVAGWPTDGPVAVHPRFADLTLDVILRVVLGAREGAEDLRDAIRRALRLTHSAPRLVGMSLVRRDLGPLSPYGAFVRAMRDVDDRLAAHVAAATPGPDSVLGLLKTSHRDPALLRDELVTLLAAGHETTATALAWAAERLAREPEVQDWARGDDERLGAVADETLRARPVLSLAARRTSAPLEVRGVVLPAGTQVAPALLLAMRDPSRWGEDAALWRPSRWLDGSPRGAFVPWGGGTRRCLGAAFARLELVEVLRALLDARTLRPDRAKAERARRRSVTIAPARGARVRLEHPSSPRMGGQPG